MTLTSFIYTCLFKFQQFINDIINYTILQP
jgi:hypothetical protein